jgi:hypothetical protein
MVIDAWRAEEAMRVEREATKKQKEVLDRWNLTKGDVATQF